MCFLLLLCSADQRAFGLNASLASKAHISVLREKNKECLGRERVSYKSLELVTVAKETTSLVSARSSHLSLLLCLALRKSCNLMLKGGGVGRRLRFKVKCKDSAVFTYSNNKLEQAVQKNKLVFRKFNLFVSDLCEDTQKLQRMSI